VCRVGARWILQRRVNMYQPTFTVPVPLVDAACISRLVVLLLDLFGGGRLLVYVLYIVVYIGTQCTA
jgi:hypothetical protein